MKKLTAIVLAILTLLCCTACGSATAFSLGLAKKSEIDALLAAL